MYTFFSPYRKYVARDNAGTIAKFENGHFITPDLVLAEKLRIHPMYGKKIHEKGSVKPKANLIQGIRSAATQPILDRDNKLLRLGELRAKLLKKDGNVRKDAGEEEIKEMHELEQIINN
jgi:hypothetical protein